MMIGKKLIAYMFMFFFSLILIFSNGHWGGDGLENYLAAESIVLKGNLIIYDKPFQVKEMKYSVRGQVDNYGYRYASEGIGMSLALVPFYALGHLLAQGLPSGFHDYITQFIVALANPLLIALTAVLLFVFLRRLLFKASVAFLTAISFVVCTMSLAYARSGFSEPAIGLLVLFVFFLLHRYEKEKLLRYVFFVSCLLGYALLIKKNSFLYIPLWLAYGFHRGFSLGKRQLKPAFLSAAFMPVFSFIGIYFLFHHSITAAVTGLHQNALGEIASSAIAEKISIFKALFYYFFSPGKGYFFYNVILILALFGIKSFYAKNRKLAIYLLIFILTQLLFYSYRFQRGSLFSWGPRYLYPTVPLMCLFLAQFIANAHSLRKKALLFITFIVSFLVQLPVFFINITKYLLFVKEKLNIAEYLINFVPDLSPIRGAWFLFLSSLHKLFTGKSLVFTYAPDPIFVKPVAAVLDNYDVWDIWWFNVGCVSEKLFFIAHILLVILIVTAIFSFSKMRSAFVHEES